MNASRKFAVFDIDGTLLRWQLFHAIVDELGKHGHIPKPAYDKALAARMVWKGRTGKNSFKSYEKEMVAAYSQAINKLLVSDFMSAIESVFGEYKDQVYTYTRNLLRELKAKGYLLFAISGSQAEVVKMLADYYGFDASVGSTYERSGDRFTGQCHILTYQKKNTALAYLVSRFGATNEGSIAVGDSEGDIPILSLVEHPIAFNPSQSLFDHARNHAWEVVIERKNVTYRLVPKDGQYILATAKA
jgi:HAD superfamily hydrolase (TIGR01490 family)